MVKQNFLTKMLLLCALIVVSVSSAWAADDEITFSSYFSDITGTNTKDINNEEITIGSSTVVFSKVSGNNNPMYYANGSAIRFYNKTTMTISCTTKKIAKIEMTFTSGTPSSTNFTANCGTLTYNDKTPSWAGESNSVEFTTTTTLRISKISITYTYVSAPLDHITLSGNYPTSFYKGDAFSHEGMTVTATYGTGDEATTKDVTSQTTFAGYNMETTGTQNVTASYTEGTITKTAEYQITVSERPKHNVIWSINGTTTTEECELGASITFPENPAAIEGKVFMGWTATAIVGTTNNAPAFVTEATMGDADLTFYAVFAKATEGGDDTYEKLTSNSFETNATYVIGAKGSGTDDDIYYLYSYYNKVDENASWGLVSADLDTNTPITFTLSGTSDALVAKDNSNHYLVGLTTANFKMSSTSTSVALSSDGSIKNSSSGTYYLRYNTAGGLRWYSSSTGQKAYFYKVIPGIIYSEYSTTVVPENVTITPTKEYVSFSSPYPLDFTNTAGLTAYVVSAETSTSVTLTEVNKVPVNTGLVLKGTANTEYTVPVLSGDADLSGDAEAITNNKLKGTGTEGVTGLTPKSVYVLSDGKFKVYTGTEIAGGKAYLPKTSDSEAPSLSFDFGEGTTGIQNIERTINDNQYYTLDGRRVAQPTKGLYIINGKKVIIK